MKFSLAMTVVALALSACGGGSSGSTSGTTGHGSGTPAGTSGANNTTTTGGISGTGSAGNSTGQGSATNGSGSSSGSTSGTSTGGLAAGSPCDGDSACASGVCGVAGSGNCCASACSTSDTHCGAPACDGTGACSYPIQGTSCGAASCTGNELTAPACDGFGACASATSACPGHTACAADGVSCLNTCASTADCAAGFVCNASACVTRAPTGTCTDNDNCTSGVCGLSGTGNCCNAACAATDDPLCNATQCDDLSGACLYPAGASCGAEACVGSSSGAGLCDANGVCQPDPVACPNNFGCEDAGAACNTSCSQLADCAAGFYCVADAGSCVAQITAGSCVENDACTSGVCGLAGSGNCCNAACLVLDPTCGATDCDATTAACDYPLSGTACGIAVQSCTGSTSQGPSACDGTGSCAAPAPVDCTPYVCGPTACLTSCSDNSSCGTSGDFCDVPTSACCALTVGGTLAVDSINGSDATACCGIGSNGPCQTIGRGMSLINAARAQKVTLNATVDGGGGDWAPADEIYPIVLGWGVELSAPDIYFYDSANPGNPEIFEIASYSANDTVGYASIVGTSQTDLVWIGMDSLGDQSLDSSAIQVEANQILYIANATVNGSASAQTTAITLVGSATMAIDTDASSLVTGTLNIGAAALGDGWTGIACVPAAGQGCQIVDSLIGGASSVVIQGQENVDIDAENYSNITLAAAPIIGVAPTGGFGTCPSKNDSTASGTEAVLLHGQATVSFSGGTVQCISGAGFELLADGPLVPSLTIDSSTIRNTEYGVYASAGSASVSATTIEFNYHGVQQDTDGTRTSTIDLSGGTSGTTNTVVCSSNAESIYSAGGGLAPGVSVLNTTASNLDASNTDWDTKGPDLFTCTDSSLATCSCPSTTCALAAGADGMDAVEASTGAVTTTGNGLSTIACGG